MEADFLHLCLFTAFNSESCLCQKAYFGVMFLFFLLALCLCYNKTIFLLPLWSLMGLEKIMLFTVFPQYLSSPRLPLMSSCGEPSHHLAL